VILASFECDSEGPLAPYPETEARCRSSHGVRQIRPMRSADRCQRVSRARRCKIRIKALLVDSKLCEIARCEFTFLFCRAVRRNNEVRNIRDAGMLHRAGDRYPLGSYAMANRRLGPALVLGVVSILAASMATPSVGQTQRQGPAAQHHGFAPASPLSDETFGQATRAQAPHAHPDPMANRQPGSCWIPTDEDFGVGYWGPCSDKKSRQVK
jgi:hypothetical protein